MFRGTVQCFSLSLPFSSSLSITEPAPSSSYPPLRCLYPLMRFLFSFLLSSWTDPAFPVFSHQTLLVATIKDFWEWRHNDVIVCGTSDKSSLFKYYLKLFSSKKVTSLLHQSSSMVSVIWELWRPSSLVNIDHHSEIQHFSCPAYPGPFEQWAPTFSSPMYSYTYYIYLPFLSLTFLLH